VGQSRVDGVLELERPSPPASTGAPTVSDCRAIGSAAARVQVARVQVERGVGGAVERWGSGVQSSRERGAINCQCGRSG
jgi:hypothetical protein